ncbi:Moesin/ezrin/radixin -like protein 1 [Trichinella pseudospiralis]|uniref:Moesin/ezrin/radixin homolog 1 n=2 Tax=Trichinella pseudospiralis TaxID=6337 RepID=A0A0V1IBN4_TRIPS|nr:Moesin/ezrin/radixin -like protein 1 [Trichinella pseudospiralis]KRZ20251.1 Moesin/ezrin/radixin -like protein 1 [Trichinella pseudospiralis]KRZ39103.1 Moesin/ezrin/radixin -like protein 1 [Trichinella pseudospiralis]
MLKLELFYQAVLKTSKILVRFQDHLPAFGEQFYTSCDRLSDQQIARSTVLKIWEVFKAGFLRFYLLVKMPSKPVSVRVTTMDAELEFAIQSNTTGKQLFDQVVKTIGLREIWYFGLQYTDTKGYITWLKLNKKILNQELKRESPLQFKFRAKFYPEDVSEEIIQDVTLRLFYLQVKEAILSDEIYCPPETTVLLASYAMQARFGDYHPDVHKKGFLANERLMPERVREQYKLSSDQWEEKIVSWWSEHKCMMKEDAMGEYLKIAQDLEMYGVNYFEIRNKKGSELWLGVDALGLNIYEKADRLTPKIGFPWSEIRNISFNDKKFVIKPIDKKARDFIFYVPRLRINKRILALCMGNHELYMRRRKPDTIEVQQMRAQAREERQQKVAERERLQREIAAREAAEKKQREYEDRMLEMQEDMERAKRDLTNAQDTIRRLELSLKELQQAQENLARREEEVKHLGTRLAEEREMEASEKDKLEAEIRRREAEIAAVRREVSEKDAQTRRLQEEVEEARRRQQEASEALLRATTQALHHNKAHNVFEHMEDNYALSNGGDYKVELTSDEYANVPQWEVDRQTAIERNQNIQTRLDALNADLEKMRDRDKVTEYDVLHMENKRAGRDKYKTLRQIRAGNTQRRIDQFENMV